MLGEERREHILNLLKKTGSVSAIEIARVLNVSETTIRRDLDKLAKKKLLRRTHGGAIDIIPVGKELRFDIQKEKFIEEKKNIALAAAKLVDEDDVILIEAGTTGYQTAVYLTNRKNLTLITNSCDIAIMLSKTNPGYKVILSGGILKTDTHSLIGPIADYAFQNLNVDKAFIGISGLDIQKGITAADQIEAKTKMEIIKCAKKVIALCDHSKLGHVSMNFVAPVDTIDILITDSESDIDFLDKLKDLGIEIIY